MSQRPPAYGRVYVLHFGENWAPSLFRIKSWEWFLWERPFSVRGPLLPNAREEVGGALVKSPAITSITAGVSVGREPQKLDLDLRGDPPSHAIPATGLPRLRGPAASSVGC